MERQDRLKNQNTRDADGKKLQSNFGGQLGRYVQHNTKNSFSRHQAQQQEFKVAIKYYSKIIDGQSTPSLCFPKGISLPDVLNIHNQKQLEKQQKARKDSKVHTCSVCARPNLGIDKDTRRYQCPKTNTVTCSFECY